MSCKHLKIEKKTYRQMDSDDVVIERYHCQLKLQSEKKKLKVYDELFKLGYQGSVVTTDCPFAEINELKECPFFITFP